MKSDAISEETFDTKLITTTQVSQVLPHTPRRGMLLLELQDLQPVLKPLAKLEYVIIFFMNCSDS